MRKRVSKISWIFFLCIVIMLVCLAGCEKDYSENPPREPEYVFTYAENQPDYYPTSKAADRFAEIVAEKSEGRIHIQVIYDAEFGTQQQVVNQMKFGGVDFARVSLSSLSDEIPELNILQLPFLYGDAEHMWRVLDGEVGKELENSFSKLDLEPLAWFDAGARSFYFKSPVETIDDLAGKNIRVQESQLMRDMITLLGGNPIEKAYSEVYSAFETGEIDGAENSWSSYNTSAHYNVAQYYMLDEHTRVPEIQLIAGETLRILSEEDIQILKSAATEAAEYEKELWNDYESDARKNALQYGCKEILLSDSEMTHLREKMEPLYEKYCSQYLDMIEKIEKVR